MSVNLRFPNINGLSEKEQLQQIRTYLYQLVGELQFALNDTTSPSNSIVASSKKDGGGSANLSNMDAKAVFAVLKPLIIKSADIVNSYYEKIYTKLEGKYVAESDFGIYQEETKQEIEETSTAIEQAFTNIQTIDTDLQGVFTDVQTMDTKVSGELSDVKKNLEDATKALSDSIKGAESDLSESIDGVSKALEEQLVALAKKVESVLTVNAYIKSGLLYYNEEELPVYGVEVGQTNNVNGVDTFRKFARFTADRLSFYDQNDTEVAYISDYKLYITSVEILYNLIGGGFMLDFSRGFTLKYRGGE